MVFNSLTFIIFFASVLALYAMLSSWQLKKGLLLVASYLFYGAWNPPFVLLLALSTTVDWFAASRMELTREPRKRRLWLLLTLVSNLGLLGYFKYGGFLLTNFVALAAACGLPFHPAAPSIVLPVGISFYTFQTLSYTLDVYRKQLRPARSLLDFALFVAFFPQLVAGPIVRASDLLPQFEKPKFITRERLGWGLFLLSLGLFQKLVMADALFSDAADAVFSSPGPASALDTWLGTMAFAGQIFSDFAGYSTCAIGASCCLGFSLVENFHAPYAAVGLRDFWRRWHISLSTWLRDYLYIPLGGNRHGARRTSAALAGTMLLGGLWHGASWNFVIWGALHGVFLAIERAIGPRLAGAWSRSALGHFVLGALTFALVCIAWVFFRATDLPRAMMHLAAMFGAIGAAPILKTTTLAKTALALIGLLAVHIAFRQRRIEDVSKTLPAPLLTAVWALMLGAIVLAQGGGDAFIYFQF